MSIKDKIMEIINNPCGDCDKKCALNSPDAIECQLVNIEGGLAEYFFEESMCNDCNNMDHEAELCKIEQVGMRCPLKEYE